MLQHILGMEVRWWGKRAWGSPSGTHDPTVTGVSSGVQGLAQSLTGLKTRSCWPFPHVFGT